jgi:hypothetical protein
VIFGALVGLVLHSTQAGERPIFLCLSKAAAIALAGIGFLDEVDARPLKASRRRRTASSCR